MHDIGKSNRQAQLRGSLLGLAIGVMSAAFGRRFYKMNPNQALLTGFLTGMTSAYGSTQYLLSRYLAAQVESQETLSRTSR